MNALRVAVWQCVSRPLDVGGNLARLGDACARAAAAGADVLVTPELFLTGYAIGNENVRRLAEPVDGPTSQAVAEITRSTGVAVAVGLPELDAAGQVYNTALLLDDGAVIGSHRKMHLFGGLDRDQFTPGDRRPDVLDLRGHRVGLLICYDVEFPETARCLAAQGAEAILVPTANMVAYELVSTVIVRARAYENGVFVAYANYTGPERELEYGGLSTVCAPDGVVLALAGDGEELLVTELVSTPGMGYLADRRTDLFGADRG
jgi:predicted amidohydrolase